MDFFIDDFIRSYPRDAMHYQRKMHCTGRGVREAGNSIVRFIYDIIPNNDRVRTCRDGRGIVIERRSDCRNFWVPCTRRNR